MKEDLSYKPKFKTDDLVWIPKIKKIGLVDPSSQYNVKKGYFEYNLWIDTELNHKDKSFKEEELIKLPLKKYFWFKHPKEEDLHIGRTEVFPLIPWIVFVFIGCLISMILYGGGLVGWLVTSLPVIAFLFVYLGAVANYYGKTL